MTNDNKRSLPRANFDRPIVGAKRDFEQYTNKIAIATGGGWAEGSFGGPTNQPKSNFVPIHINPKRRISARARAIEQNTDTHRHIKIVGANTNKNTTIFRQSHRSTERDSCERRSPNPRGIALAWSMDPLFSLFKGSSAECSFQVDPKARCSRSHGKFDLLSNLSHSL